ncbi:MAG: MarR family transcriptional regulator [Candidatus Omnitrophica bacterium]|nr:MarR family transcriptional regulator [Candidatus Omnitrophota bacterium]MDD5487903.1 MarR family transcriptional regulator [Candidatus Omnitrophota bacterium]
MKKQSITYFLREIAKKVYVNASRHLKSYGLTFSQYQVLMLLQHCDTLSMSEIRDELLITHAGVTSLMNKLVKKEMVERGYSPEDRRKVMVTITERGKGTLDKLFTGHKEFSEKLSESLGKDKVEDMKRSLRLLLDFLDGQMKE